MLLLALFGCARGGHRGGEKSGPWMLPPEGFGHEHFGFASLCFFLSLLSDPGSLGYYQKRLAAFLLCSPSSHLV